MNSHIAICDKCETKTNLKYDSYYSKWNFPDNWKFINGKDLCPDCWLEYEALFENFMSKNQIRQ